jgi:hypothetical protein
MYQILPIADTYCIQRTHDQAFIPEDPANTDYLTYLEWKAAQQTEEAT